MKELFKKILVILLSLVAVFSAVACGGSEEDYAAKEDEDKVNIYVANFDGGFGREWLEKAIARFEASVANVEFESGKKGAHIIIDDSLDKEQLKGANLQNLIADNRASVFFTEQFYFYTFAINGLIADITDVVTEVNSDGKTIESKLNENQKDYLKLNGKYYGIPHYMGFSGIMYDIDLFEEEKLYFGLTAEDCDDGGFIVNKQATRAYGPDGKTGVIDGVDYSLDDGLPATYDDFITLCKRMVDKSIIPFIWSGEYKDPYTREFLTGLAVDYEGLEKTMVNFTLNGNVDVVTSIEGSDWNANVTTEEVAITTENGYLLQQQAGKYYALSLFNAILDTTYSGKKLYASNKALNTSYSHTDAQDEFLLSRPEGNPIAMLIDGNWWENEADNSNTFEDSVSHFGAQYSRENRRLGMMPYPKVNENELGGITLLDSKYSTAFINANCTDPAKLAVAKAFLKFCYTDESLVEFNTTTNVPKAVQYEMSAEKVAQLTPFGKNIYETVQRADIVYPYTGSDFFYAYGSKLELYNQYRSKTSIAEYVAPVDALRADGIDAYEYFMGFKEYYTLTYWQNNFSL